MKYIIETVLIISFALGNLVVWSFLPTTQDKNGHKLLNQKCKEFGLDDKPFLSINLRIDPNTETAYCYLHKGITVISAPVCSRHIKRGSLS